MANNQNQDEKRYTMFVDGKKRTVKASVFNENMDEFVNDMPDATIEMIDDEGKKQDVAMEDLSMANSLGYTFVETDQPIYVNSKAPEKPVAAPKPINKPAPVKQNAEQQTAAPASAPATEGKGVFGTIADFLGLGDKDETPEKPVAAPADEQSAPTAAPEEKGVFSQIMDSFIGDEDADEAQTQATPEAQTTAANPAMDWKLQQVGVNPDNKGIFADKQRLGDIEQQLYDVYEQAYAKPYMNGQKENPKEAVRNIAIQMGIEDDDQLSTTNRIVEEVTNRFLSNKAAQTAADIIAQMPEKTTDPAGELKKLIYERGVQQRIWQEGSAGANYGDYVREYLQPYLKEGLAQKYNGWNGYMDVTSSLDVANDEMNRNDATKIITAEVQTPIQEAIAAFDKKATQTENAVLEGMGRRNIGLPMGAKMGEVAEAQRQANITKDPQKILSYLAQQVGEITGKASFRKEIMKAAQEAEMQPEEYMKRYVEPYFRDVLKEEFDKAEIQKMMPEGSLEYVLKTGLGNSIVGQIVRKVGNTDYQNWLEDMAAAQYDAGFWDKVNSGALTFGADMWSYMIPGGVGGKITKNMMQKAVGKVAADLTARGMERAAAERAAGIILQRSVKDRVAQGAVSGAVTFGGQSVIGTPVNEVYQTGQNGKEWNTAEMLTRTMNDAASGAILGMIMQGKNIAGMLTEGKGLAKNIAGDVAGTAADATLMAGHGTIEQLRQDPDFEVTGKGIAESILESFVSLGMLGAGHTIGKYANWKSRQELAKKSHFNDADEQMLQERGYNDLIDGLVDMGRKRTVEGETAEGEGLQERTFTAAEQEQAVMLNERYKNLLRDNEVPETLKAKVMSVVEGRVPSALSPVTDINIEEGDAGTAKIVKRAADGRVVEEERYNSWDEADKALEKISRTEQEQVGRNRIAAAQDIYAQARVEEDFTNIYAEAVEKTRNNEPLTEQEQRAVYLQQQKQAYRDASRKREGGEELTDQEARLLENYQQQYEQMLRESNSIDEYNANFAEAHDLTEQEFVDMINGHEKEGEGDVFEYGRYYTPEQLDMRYEYQRGLIAERKGEKAEETGTEQEPGKGSSYNDDLQNVGLVMEGQGSGPKPDLPNTGLLKEENATEGQAAAEGQTSTTAAEGQAQTQATAEGQTSTTAAEGQAQTVVTAEPQTQTAAEPQTTVAARPEQYEQAWQNGRAAMEDYTLLPKIQFEDDLAVAQVAKSLQGASAKQKAVVDNVKKALQEEHGLDAAVMYYEQNKGTLSLEQQTAVEAMLQAEAAEQGFTEAVEDEVSAYAADREQELQELTDAEGKITPLRLQNGEDVFYVDGDLNNATGTIVVRDQEGKTYQVAQKDILDVQYGQVRPVMLHDQLRQDVDAFRKDLEDSLKGMAEGSVMMPEQEVDLILYGSPLHVKVLNETESGDIVMQAEDGSVFTLNGKEAAQGVEAANALKIQQIVEQQAAQAAAAVAERQQAAETERQMQGIVGLREGEPDYTHKDTDATIAANVLSQDKEGSMKMLQELAEELADRKKKAAFNLKRQKAWLEANYDEYTAEERAAKEDVISKAEETLQDADQRMRKIGKIIQRMLTQKEYNAYKTARRKKIRDITGKITPSYTAEEPVKIEKKALMEEYATMDDAAKALSNQKAGTLKAWNNSGKIQLDDAKALLEAYEQGFTELTDSEISAAGKTVLELEAMEADVLKKLQSIKNYEKMLPVWYKERNEAALAEMTEQERRHEKLEKAKSIAEYIKTAREEYGKSEFGFVLDELDTPQTVEDFVSESLPAHSIDPESLKKETGLRVGRGKGDFKGMSMLLAGKDKGGKSIDQLAHEIWENRPEHMMDLSSTDVKSALLDLLTSATKPSDIYCWHINRLIDEIERLEDAQEAEYEQYMSEEALSRQEDEQYIDYLDVIAKEIGSDEKLMAFFDGLTAQEAAKDAERRQEKIDKLTKNIEYEEGTERHDAAGSGMDKEPERRGEDDGAEGGDGALREQESTEPVVGGKDKEPRQDDRGAAETAGSSVSDGSVPVQDGAGELKEGSGQKPDLPNTGLLKEENATKGQATAEPQTSTTAEAEKEARLKEIREQEEALADEMLKAERVWEDKMQDYVDEHYPRTDFESEAERKKAFRKDATLQQMHEQEDKEQSALQKKYDDLYEEEKKLKEARKEKSTEGSSYNDDLQNVGLLKEEGQATAEAETDKSENDKPETDEPEKGKPEKGKTETDKPETDKPETDETEKETEKAYKIEKRFHKKKGIDIDVVNFDERFDRPTFLELKKMIKDYGGYYSSFGKGGFIFENGEENAREFADAVIEKYGSKEAVAAEQLTPEEKGELAIDEIERRQALREELKKIDENPTAETEKELSLSKEPKEKEDDTRTEETNRPAEGEAGSELPDVGADAPGTDGGVHTGRAGGDTDSRKSGRKSAADGRKSEQRKGGPVEGRLFDVGDNGHPEEQSAGEVHQQGAGRIESGKKSKASAADAESAEEVRLDNHSVKTATEKERPLNTRNYLYPENAPDIDSMSMGERTFANVKAMEVVRDCLRDNRQATDEERVLLGEFRGWGGTEASSWWGVDYMRRRGSLAAKQLADIIDELDPDGKIGVLDNIRKAALTSYYTPIALARGVNHFLERGGYTGGGVYCDGSMGNGVLEGTMPKKMQQSTQIYGVELDWTTAQIAKLTYPDADIRNMGYQDFRMPDNHFDVVGGNIPFGSIEIYDATWKNSGDPVKKFAQKKIHNYFAVKMIDQLKPGGLGYIITSNAILDTKGNQVIRQFIADNTEILGIVRLPDNMFKGAGTKVITDVIMFRKYRNTDDAAATRTGDYLENIEKPFLSRATQKVDTVEVGYNGYFEKHPEMMIGEVKAGGQYRKEEFGLTSDIPVADICKKVMELIDENVVPDSRKGRLYDTHRSERQVHEAVRETYIGNGDYTSDGNIVEQNGKLGVLANNGNGLEFQEVSTLKKSADRVRAMIPLRTALKKLISSEIGGEDDKQLAEQRKDLRNLYNDYIEKFGRLHDKGNNFIDTDIDGYTIRSLEKWKDNKFVGLSDIFEKTTIKPKVDLDNVKTPEEAITVSLAEYGEIRPDFMQDRLGDDWEQMMGGKLFRLPSGGYQIKDLYLSGNVKAKLAEAKLAAATDPAFEENVKALEEVVPKDIPFIGINVHMGARWVPDHIYTSFLHELLGLSEYSDSGIRYSPEADEFTVYIDKNDVSGKASEYGTVHKSNKDLIEAALLDQRVSVVVTARDGSKQYLEDETIEANGIIEQIREAFEDYIVTHIDVAKELSEIYNEKFNTTVIPRWDGSHLQVPGLQDKTLRPHQKDAVWMLINNRGGIIDHIVGAGKTLVMHAAIMEMRRMGIAKKPMIIALKSTIKQMANEFRQCFPTARVLAPTEKDFAAKNRKKLLSNIAVNDWDCIILSHDQYGMLPHDVEIETGILSEQIQQLEAAILELSEGNPDKLTKQQQKGLEKRKNNLENKIKDIMSRDTDQGFTFEKLGVDYLFVDECQHFKSLPYVTKHEGRSGNGKIAGLSSSKGSKKAVALLCAARYLQRLHQGDMGLTMLSGTTISNSLVELYNLFQYVRPNKMKELGFTSFDAWVSAFAQNTAEGEFDYKGQFVSRSRFRDFENLAELSKLYAEVADVRNDSNLKLDKPGKNVHVVTIPASDALKEINKDCIEMCKNKHDHRFGYSDTTANGASQPWALLAANISTKAAVSVKLVDSKLDDGGGKIVRVCNNVKELYDKFDADKGTQVIFCDLGVPDAKKDYDVYSDFIARLTNDYGIPREEIADIHDYSKDEKKEGLLKKINDGDVRVLIAGSVNGGTGLNIQKRLIGIHHVDMLWNPAGITQEDGRGVRQGNWLAKEKNGNKVEIYYYATENSLDLYKYQLVSTKQKMIDRFKTGVTSEERTFDEGAAGGNEDFDPASVVAVLSGNPIIMEKAKHDKYVEKLIKMKRQYLISYEQRISDYNHNMERLKMMEVLARKNAEDKAILDKEGFKPGKDNVYPATVTVSVDGKEETFTKPKEAGTAILKMLKEGRRPTLRAFGMDARIVRELDPETNKYVYKAELTAPSKIKYTVGVSSNPVQAGTTMRSLLQKVISNGDTYEREVKKYKHKTEGVDTGAPAFPKEEELKEALKEKSRIDEEYNQLIEEEEENTEVKKSTEQGAAEKVRKVEAGMSEGEKALRRGRIATAGKDVAEKLGGAEAVAEDETTVSEAFREKAEAEGIKGWYDEKDGSVHLYMPNIESEADGQFTVCHEKLGHEGLRALLGSDEAVTAFGQYIFDNAGKEIRQRIIERADQEGYDWDDEKRFAKAAEEVFSDIAGEGPATEAEFTLWQKVKHYLIKVLKKLGIRIRGLLNDKDIRYYVLKTGEALKRWNKMSAEEKAEAARTDGYGARYSRSGRPRKKNGESQAQYLQRLRTWEKWRKAEEAAKAENNPLPSEEAYNDRYEEKYKADMEAWKAEHGIAADDKGVAEMPKRGQDESPQEYAKRVADYETRADIWKTAPDYFSYMADALAEYKKDYRAWKERYDVEDMENVDLNIYEGYTPKSEDEKTEEEHYDDMEIDMEADKDLAEAVGIETDDAGARRLTKLAIIERRKNLESASAEDAIFIHDLTRRMNEAAKEMGMSEESFRKEMIFAIERPLYISNMENEAAGFVDAINNSMTFDFAHTRIDKESIKDKGVLEAMREFVNLYIDNGSNPGIAKKEAMKTAAGKLAKKLNEWHASTPGYVNMYAEEVMNEASQLVNLYYTVANMLREDDFAKNPKVQGFISELKDWYDNFYHLLEDAGLKRADTGYIAEGYVNHVWDKGKSDKAAYEKVQENYKRTQSANMKKREVMTYTEGINIGLIPKFTDISDLLAYYSRQNNEAIANRRLLDDLAAINVEEMNSDGEIVSVVPMTTTDKPDGLTSDKYAYYRVPGVGDLWVHKAVQTRFASVFGSIRTKDIPEWLTKTGHIYDVTSGVAKKIQLSLSGFHMGALTEVAIAQMGPIKGMKAVMEYVIRDSIKSGTLPAYAHPEDFKFAASHLVQLGATQDYAAADVNNAMTKIREAVQDLAKSENIALKGVGTAATPLALFNEWINKGIDTLLWNYLHDGLKIACFKQLAEKELKRAKKMGLSAEMQDKMLDEVGQYVNDTFGGQYWELLNVSPGTLKWLRRALLSPDWFISTMRHFLANFGIGSLYNEGGWRSWLKYNKDNIKRLFGADIDRMELMRLRSENANYCYLVGVCIFFYGLMNVLNSAFRAYDEEKERRKAEEIRKTDPTYRSPYELAYPDGMKWYDYTMLGNSLGQQTHLFVGRYEDGTETYVRWGKQFREMPEMFIGQKGVDFPAPMIQRMMGKANPNVSLIRDNLGVLGIWGFSNSNEMRDIEAKYGRTIALLAMNARHFLPFSVPTQAEKEFKAVDLFMPSSKGFTRYKAISYFKDFIKAGDMEQIMRTYQAATMNGIDAEMCLEAAITTLRAEQKKEMAGGITDLQGAMNGFDDARDIDARREMRKKINMYMAGDAYKTFTQFEARQMVEDYMNPTDADEPLTKSNDKYLMAATAEDIRDDYKMDALYKEAREKTKQIEALEDQGREAQAGLTRSKYKAWIEIYDELRQYRKAANKLKKELDGKNDESVMKELRELRRETQKNLDAIEPPK